MEKVKNIALVALAIFVILLLIDRSSGSKERADLLEQISKFDLERQEFRSQRAKDSSLIATQQQTFLTQAEALKLGLIELEGKIKKIQSQAWASTRVNIQDVTVPYKPISFSDTLPGYTRFENGKLVSDSLAVPRPFEYRNQWFEISGQVRKSGIFLDSVIVKNKTTTTVGYERKNIFSRLKPVVQIKNENPYMEVTDMGNVVIKERKGIFQRKGFWFAVGAIGGFLITK